MADDVPPIPNLRWIHRPRVESPVLVVAFGGWSDAGEAATSAARFLADHWDAQPFATIDPEPFFDFTSTRPTVRFDQGGGREIVWPDISFSVAPAVDDHPPVVVLVGDEPQLAWRSFARTVLGVAEHLEVSTVVSLGALLADVPHARPVSVFGVGDGEDEDGLMPSTYEGPTGITGVLQVECERAGLASASFWAAVPTYVPVAPSPKAALALVERTARLLRRPVDVSELQHASGVYEREVTSLVEDDDETAAYVRQLEDSYDESQPQLLTDPAELVAEVERYLRNQD